MKYISSLKYFLATIIIINVSFYVMAKIGDSKLLVSRQNGEEITLIPVEAYLRGQIEISDTQKITNWRNSKNSVHWKYECTEPGVYAIVVNHNKVSKELPLTVSTSGKKFTQNTVSKTTKTVMGEIELTEGIHGLALYIEEMPKKSKLVDLGSISFKKINQGE